MSKKKIQLNIDGAELKKKLKIVDGTKGEKGDKGDKGDTTTVDRIIEKTEVIKEVPNIDTALQIADKLNQETEIIEQKVIIGLEESLNKKITDGIQRGGGSGGIFLYADGAKKGKVNTIDFTGSAVSWSKVNGMDTLTFEAPAGYTDEQAQDAVGGMVDATLTYDDGTPSLGINLSNSNTWLADQSVPDEAYGAGWNGSMEVPTKNALYDKIETLAGGTPGGSDTQVQFNDSGSFGGDAGFTYNKTTDSATLVGDLTVADEVYGAGWNGSLEVPTKNALYDKIETLGTVTGATDSTLTLTGTTLGLNLANDNTYTGKYNFSKKTNIVITGSLSPDVTGTYVASGTYNGFEYWQGPNGFIWHNSNYWYIGATLGVNSGWYIDNTFALYPPSSSAWNPQGGSGTLTTAQDYLVNFNGLGPIGFNAGPVNFTTGLGVNTTVPSNPLSVNGRSDFFGNLGIYTQYPPSTAGVIQPQVALDIFGSIVSGSVGTEDVFHMTRLTSGGVSYPELVAFKIGRYATTGAYEGKTRFDIALKSTADATMTGDVTVMTLQDNKRVGIGTTLAEATLHLLATTVQQRTAYDASNYFDTTVGSTGGVTFDAVGSGAKFNFSDVVNLPTYTVATLPTGATGDVARVSDGDASLAWGDTVINSGAGATPYMVWYNGSNWTVTGK